MGWCVYRTLALCVVSVCLCGQPVEGDTDAPSCSKDTEDSHCLESDHGHSVLTRVKEEEEADQPPACPHPPPRPRQDDKESQSWQKVDQRMVMVFSAYVERRATAGGPAIRIVGTGWQGAYNDIGELHCQLWYEDRAEMVPIGPANYIRIYPSTLHPDMWVSHFIMCPLPDHIPGTPYAVSVTPSSCAAPLNTLVVLGREEITRGNSFALCVSPLYNFFPNWTMIAEWFELHKLLGAEEIAIYNLSVTPQTNTILQHYVDDPEANVKVIQWPYPTEHKSNVWCQRGALNDCLYRMGLKHRYVTITDLDEILVPREFATWPQLLEKIDLPERGAFLFQHAYFRRNYTGEEPYFVTQQSLWRTPDVVPPGKIRCKSMYKVDKTVKIDLHFPYQLVPGATEYILPPEEGMLHHYRFEPMETFRKNPERYTFIEDTFMIRFRERLRENVQRVMRQL